MKAGSIQDMLSRLSKQVDFPSNAHAFRRGFACNMHKRGLSTLTIMHLGRWSSLEMVQRYTRSVTFEDSLVFWIQYLCRAPAIEWPCRALWHQGTEEATINGLLVTRNLASPVSATVFGNAGEIQEPLSSGFTPGAYCAQ